MLHSLKLLQLLFGDSGKHIRMRLVYVTMELPVPNKADLKKEAKIIKKFLVFIKLKLARQQVCRAFLFRKLMALVYDPDEQERVSCCSPRQKKTLL